MRIVFTLILISLCSYKAQADTFIVTSNADSGPGSLREMIVAANNNGTAITDYIYFNIPQPDFNLRIINLVTELPSLNSKIVIDGSTQPGAKYGSTQAGICVKMNSYAPAFSMIKIENASDVEVYGLMLFYGYWQGLFGTPRRSELLYGIDIINSVRITIGAPGKGNVITGVFHGIFSSAGLSSDVTIKSNYLGHQGFYTNTALDIDPVVIMSDCGITLGSVKNIMIGGSSPAEGNIFGSKTRAVNIDSRNTTGNGFLRMQNNIFGRKYDKTTLINVYDFWDAYVTIGRSRNNPVNWSLNHTIDYNVKVLDNDLPNHIFISYVSDSLIIKRNNFEEDQRSTTGTSVKLGIYKSPGAGMIGGIDQSDANSFKYKDLNTSFYSISVYECGPITIYKNVFDCNTGFGSTTRVYHYNNLIPIAQVDETTASMVRGRATPGTRVDLYYDDACTGCEGKQFITSVIANGAGNWIYNATITGTVVASATSSAGYTSNFSEPTFNYQNKVVVQPTCGRNNGSVTGATSEGAEAWFWLKFGSTDTISRSIDLINVGPGDYTLYGVHGTCIKPGQYFRLEDNTPQIWQNGITVTQPSCGVFNGGVYGLVAAYSQNATYKWINNAGATIGTNLNISGLGEGTYHFVLTDITPGGGCSDTASFVLTNLSGPTLNVNQIQIRSASCGTSTGRITGIVTSGVNGTPFIQWVNTSNITVGNSLDLLNVALGQYRLKFKDGTACDTIITPFYTVTDVGNITIDTNNKFVSPSECLGNTGSILQLNVTGGESFTWINMQTNAAVGNSLDVYNLPSGNYQLRVRNNFGCEKLSPIIHVPQSDFSPIEVSAFNTGNAVCNQANAFIHVTSFSNDPSLYTLAWVDSLTGQFKGADRNLDNLSAGTYQLSATDTNGCTKKIFTAIVIDRPLPVFDYLQVNQKNDQCNLKQAAITSIKVDNLSGPTLYTWYNENNEVVGDNINLENVGSGNYILKIKDATFCNIESNVFTLFNTDNGLSLPTYDDVVIPRYSSAQLNIKNSSSGIYHLAVSPGGIILQQNTSGDFLINSVANDTSFYVTRINGTCRSEVVKVSIKVVDKSFFAVPTAFTPNGDGLNDRLNIKVMGYVQLGSFKIYNKWSEQVFETRQVNDGWDGIYKAVLQNTGSYIWIAEGKDINGLPVKGRGSFTLIR